MTNHEGLELLNCPFCGTEARLIASSDLSGDWHFWVTCSHILNPHISSTYSDKEKATTAWNTRAPSPTQAQAIELCGEALWQILDDMGEDGLCVCPAAKDQARDAYEFLVANKLFDEEDASFEPRSPAQAVAEITMGHGLVDVGVFIHGEKKGLIFHPREQHISVGEPGALNGEYWPSAGDVVIWIDNERGAQVIAKELAPFLPSPAPDALRNALVRAREYVLRDYARYNMGADLELLAQIDAALSQGESK